MRAPPVVFAGQRPGHPHAAKVVVLELGHEVADNAEHNAHGADAQPVYAQRVLGFGNQGGGQRQPYHKGVKQAKTQANGGVAGGKFLVVGPFGVQPRQQISAKGRCRTRMRPTAAVRRSRRTGPPARWRSSAWGSRGEETAHDQAAGQGKKRQGPNQNFRFTDLFMRNLRTSPAAQAIMSSTTLVFSS